MATSFRPYHPDQSLLLPPSPRDWLPEDHLAFFVAETIDALNLSAFYQPYEGDGRRKQPFDPAMMLKVSVYSYATGTYSSRKIAQKLHEDVAFRVLGAENFPAHRTISDFRKRHLGDFESVFVQLVRIAKELGLVKLGAVSSTSGHTPRPTTATIHRHGIDPRTVRPVGGPPGQTVECSGGLSDASPPTGDRSWDLRNPTRIRF